MCDPRVRRAPNTRPRQFTPRPAWSLRAWKIPQAVRKADLKSSKARKAALLVRRSMQNHARPRSELDSKAKFGASAYSLQFCRISEKDG